MSNKKINCRQCGGEGTMARHKFSEGNYKVILGLAVLIIGVGLLALFPIGTVVGVLLILYALSMGGKRRQGWKCNNCGYFFDAK